MILAANVTQEVGESLEIDVVSWMARTTGLSVEFIYESLIGFLEKLHALGVPLNWAPEGRHDSHRKDYIYT